MFHVPGTEVLLFFHSKRWRHHNTVASRHLRHGKSRLVADFEPAYPACKTHFTARGVKLISQATLGLKVRQRNGLQLPRTHRLSIRLKPVDVLQLAQMCIQRPTKIKRSWTPRRALNASKRRFCASSTRTLITEPPM